MTRPGGEEEYLCTGTLSHDKKDRLLFHYDLERY